jgi:hypothetical protein
MTVNDRMYKLSEVISKSLFFMNFQKNWIFQITTLLKQRSDIFCTSPFRNVRQM